MKKKLFSEQKFLQTVAQCERIVKKLSKSKKLDSLSMASHLLPVLGKLTPQAALCSADSAPFWMGPHLKKQKKIKKKNLDKHLFSYEEGIGEEQITNVNLQKDLVWYVDGKTKAESAQDIWISLTLRRGEETLCTMISFPLINERLGVAPGKKLSIKKNQKLRLLASTRRGMKRKIVNIYVGQKQDFERRGIESWYQQLMQSSAQSLPTVYGITRVLVKQIDVFVAPYVSLPCAYALECLFAATEGFQLSSLCHLESEYVARHQSVVVSHNISYISHIHERFGNFCEKATAKMTTMADQEKRWALAKEIAVYSFLKKYPQARLEECAVLSSKKQVISYFVRNAAVCEPVTLDHAQSYHVRATCQSYTGLVTGTYPLEKTEVELVLEACESAWQQASFVSAHHAAEKSSLAPCWRRSGQFGDVHAPGQKNISTWTKSMMEVLKTHHKKTFVPPVIQIESRVSVVVEERHQFFIDAVKQNISESYVLINDRVTTNEGNEKRQYSSRLRENRLPEITELSTLHKKQLDTAVKWAVKLLSADYAPTKIKYDYLAIDADLLGLILHEAVGHASEGDLIVTGQSGFGENNAVTKAQLGVNWLNVFIDGGLDNCGKIFVDTEGVIPQRKLIIEKGKMVDAIHTRETARLLGGAVDGCSRSESMHHPSINRMTSIWLQSTKKLPEVTLNQGDRIDSISPESLLQSLKKVPAIKKNSKILFLSGWKGGTASCSNLEFRADVGKVFFLQQGKQPVLMREANFTGIATECLKSVVAALGPHLCRSIGVCGKDGQSVPTSDGGPCIILMKKSRYISVIGSGSEE